MPARFSPLAFNRSRRPVPVAGSRQSPEELARLLPQYRIEGIIGRGGMGVVYKAHQGTLERTVAIKLLPAELTEDPNFVARFEREARTLAHLEHPGIIHVHDFGQTSAGHLYFVMEFVDGTDLYQLIHGPGLTSAQALDLVSQICDALQYAHGKGVVHRDIKPANILITREGRAKLADFGLARPVQSGESGQLTRSRVVMGTPEYMAPEQKRGEGDHRVDLYALGVMLYEMLCGRTPQGAWQVPSQQVPVDVRLDQVVIKAMQEEPARRYQQASEVKTDVDLIRTSAGETPKPGNPAQPQAPGSSVSPERDSPAPSSKKALLIGAACVIPLIGAAAWFASRQGPPAQAGAGSATASLAAAAIGHPWTNTLGLEFLPIPGAAPALLATTETRGSDWDTFLQAKQYSWKRFRDPTVSDKIKPADHPISGVSWHDANAFCEWLTEKERKEGRLPADMRYRLPTDHEWSQAAGISEDPAVPPSDLSGKDPAYAWGMTWPPPKDQFNVGDISELPGNLSWEKSVQAIRDTPPLLVDDHEETCPVKCYPPGEHGFYGLTGNVSEWVWDKWKPSHNEHGFRVLRGAGWFSLAKGGMPWLTRFLAPGLEIAAIEGMRSAKQTLLLSDRERAQPTEAWPYFGFRIALAKSAETLPDGILPLENGVRVNSLGMHLLPVDGSAKPESYIARWETRVRDYQVFATETSRHWTKPAFPQGPDHPAVLVSSQDCEAFCQWLTLRERQSGAIPQDWSYRLPTNQEWLGIFLPEPATLMAKADQLKYWSNALFNENISDHSRYAALGRKGYSYRYHDGHAWTAPVGSYKPMVRRNVSFYDVGGNVAERQICPKLTRGATPEISTIWGEDYAQTLSVTNGATRTGRSANGRRGHPLRSASG